jgi:hypothetical protein
VGLRHSYATGGRNAKNDLKALGKREVANTVADLIIGGLCLPTDEIIGQGDEASQDEN